MPTPYSDPLTALQKASSIGPSSRVQGDRRRFVNGVVVPQDSDVTNVIGTLPPTPQAIGGNELPDPTLSGLAMTGLQMVGQKAQGWGSDLLGANKFQAASDTEANIPSRSFPSLNVSGYTGPDTFSAADEANATQTAGSKFAQWGKGLFGGSTPATPASSTDTFVPYDSSRPRGQDTVVPTPEEVDFLTNRAGRVDDEITADNTPTMPDAYTGKPKPYNASYSGPALNTEEALTGLKNSGSIANASNYGSLESIPTEELYRHAFANPNSMAPGATQWNQDQLRSRLGNQEYNQSQDRAQQEAVSTGITAQHPALKALAQQKADLASQPAQYQAQGMLGSAQEQGDAARYKADLEAQTEMQKNDPNRASASAQEAAILKMYENEMGKQGGADLKVIANLRQLLTLARLGKLGLAPMVGQ